MSKIPIGCEPVVGSLTLSNQTKYRMTYKMQERNKHKKNNDEKEGKCPLYVIVFNFIDSRFFNLFAAVGGNRVTVYQCLEGGAIAVLQSYIDEDKDESFYTVSWACNIDGSSLIVAGGINGILRVIDAGNEKIHKSFVGHGDSINEIRTQALKPSLVVSASKDFHPSDIYRIVSCGMDKTVKIWSMKEFWTYVEKSFTWTDLPSKFPTKYVQFPVSIFLLLLSFRLFPCETSVGDFFLAVTSFLSFQIFIASVHNNYIDCNRWLGDFILSKSVENEIVLWEPMMKQSPGEGTVDILQKYPVPECDIWFIKFSCDFYYKAAAIGNREGKIFVWDLQSSPPTLIARLSHVQSKLPIRQTAMSFDGSTILSCCEDGTIWRWDVVATS
ncbi:polycomb group protein FERTILIZATION-INDEPENDENT ENDOSPERM-like isoform X2 [Lycium ferocissimum]|uniref:polycomb group protein FERTILIZATION-INDEPENDENT ENDOSPERM-like isoform X2 n=1 Tax=Lycium ferocissimum TaxID=112874 RepID=UPI0028162C43|nr:polycomb group protein FERTILIZATION-INDEPENDENT ENDOSPERM-like isoform X2 [Lycium ferocissimum]